MVWNLNKGKLALILSGSPGHQGFVNDVAFKPNTNRVASADTNGIILSWNARTGRWIDALLGPSGAVIALAYTGDGQTSAGGSEDHAVGLWKTKSGALIRKLDHPAPVKTLAPV